MSDIQQSDLDALQGKIEALEGRVHKIEFTMRRQRATSFEGDAIGAGQGLLAGESAAAGNNDPGSEAKRILQTSGVLRFLGRVRGGS